MQLFCFGDSITWGAWEEEGGWADRLKRSYYAYVESHTDAWIEIYNLGIPSDSSDDVAERFSGEVAARIDDQNTGRVFIFALGANDAKFHAQNHHFRCSPEQFEKNIRTLVKKAKDLSGKIYLLNVLPVIDEKNTSPDSIRSNAFIEMYNALLKKISEEEQVELIDINTAYKNADLAALLGDDGLHPNTKGHELIFQTVKERIDQHPHPILSFSLNPATFLASFRRSPGLIRRDAMSVPAAETPDRSIPRLLVSIANMQTISDIQNFVVSPGALKYIDGLHVDAFSLIRLGIEGTKRALRLGSNERLHNHAIYVDFNGPNLEAEDVAARQALDAVVRELRPTAVLLTIGSWWESTAERLQRAYDALTPQGPRLYVRQNGRNEPNVFWSMTDHMDRIRCSVWPDSIKQPTDDGWFDMVANPTMSDIAARLKKRPCTVVLHPGTITQKNRDQHEAILRECRVQMDRAPISNVPLSPPASLS